MNTQNPDGDFEDKFFQGIYGIPNANAQYRDHMRIHIKNRRDILIKEILGMMISKDIDMLENTAINL